MNEIETIRQWLLRYPGWGDFTLSVDYTDGRPGSAGLFYMGLEEVSRQTDVQCNVLLRNRMHFLLRRVNAGDGAAWAADFERWVQEQSAYGLTPKLGCLPDQERFCAQDAKLLQVDSPGTGVYQLRLFAEFYTYREGWVDDGAGV